MPQNLNLRQVICLMVLAAFLVNTSGPMPDARASELVSPQVVLLKVFPENVPIAIAKGLTVHPEDPLRFDMIVEPDSPNVSQARLRDESMTMIKYFLASLTTPEKEMWVNLSPYEKDRIIPKEFGQTLMGRDLLAEDYILKQMTASLINPDTSLGKEFWSRIYAKAQARFGTTNIPINTFNKVWIMPDRATVWEHGKSAFVIERHLKVMLEEDYLAMNKNNLLSKSTSSFPDIVREIIIPALEKEINEGPSFERLRQIYNCMILATWFKRRLKDSLLGQVYVDKNKVTGVGFTKTTIDHIYHQYLDTFKKGVFNFIKEEPDPTTGEMIPRKYFSGGMVGLDEAQLAIVEAPLSRMHQGPWFPTSRAMKVTFNAVEVNHAMSSADKDSAANGGRDWFEPYRINGLTDEQISELQRAASHSKPFKRTDSFIFENQGDVNEPEFFLRATREAFQSPGNQIVITSMGPGEKAEEPINAAKFVLQEMSRQPEKRRDILIVAYDQSEEGLKALERTLTVKTGILEDQFPFSRGKIHFKVFYGDFTRDRAENLDYWKAMTLPSNITIWRHTWVMDQGLTLEDVKAMAEVLESRISSGGLLVREYNPYHPMDPARHLVLHKIISQKPSPAMISTIAQDRRIIPLENHTQILIRKRIEDYIFDYEDQNSGRDWIVFGVRGHPELPVVKIPKKYNRNIADAQRLKGYAVTASRYYGGLVAPFTVLENVTIKIKKSGAIESVPCLVAVVQERLKRIGPSKLHHQTFMDQIAGLISRLRSRGIFYDDKFEPMNTGLTNEDRLLLVDLGRPVMTKENMLQYPVPLPDVPEFNMDGHLNAAASPAMVSKSDETMKFKVPGGINLNADNLDLVIKRDGSGMPLPLALQDWAQVSIKGLVPRIIKVQPVDLQQLLN